MDIDPVAIVTYFMRMVPTILAIVIIGIFVSLATVEIKSDDVERATVEIAENLLASQLTAEKYVFNEVRLNLYNQKDSDRKTELPFLRACSYGYFAEIKDLKTGSTWEFGYEPRGLRGLRENRIQVFGRAGQQSYIMNNIQRDLFAAIAEGDERGAGSYYGTSRQAKVDITVFETWLTRSTCLVEKAFTLKEKQEMPIPCLVVDGSLPCGFSLQRHSDASLDYLACSFQQDLGNVQRGTPREERDCRYFPREIKFEPIDVTFEGNVPDNSNAWKIAAYPIKEGANVPSCAGAGTSGAIAGKNDNVQTVLLCAEKIRTG